MSLLFLFDNVLAPTMEFAHYLRGFRQKNVDTAAFEWSYIERQGTEPQTTEPVVFIPGFSSWKGSWVRIASLVDEKYRIVIPDLPGHGRTEPKDPLADYGAMAQTRRLHAFMETTMPEGQKVHLVGVSMGGMIAGLYAALYPERVRSVTLMCPAGLTMPKKSDAYQRLEATGENLMLPRTPEQIEEMGPYMSTRPPELPSLIVKMAAAFRERSYETDKKIFNDMMTTPTLLEEHLPKIRVPALVMWGKKDRILDISSLAVLNEKMTNAAPKHIVEVEESGHMLHHEQFEVCAKAINAFLNGHEPAQAIFAAQIEK
ncbi:hypothetical protein Poli38472_006451 [Pythium oligandrum]|uniref:AB hydrolase-1 domain-containing protein n=1 Tax=Pythium oligandrum TaxID=41045 RepID=A0A8K1C4T8_PYTOL|nr:hypothetical protein Poli38472_006451 [Pythium oligandrum]|eukprot:TMW56441.1 hypothetical protein Poli38472_006451 [Pythium oligandrum]